MPSSSSPSLFAPPERRLARAQWASDPQKARPRLVSETESPTRTPFQRDRDRIIHATAFRRLAGKTQVFVSGTGDHYRSRLTHTLEVAQIARALARLLWLDDDLSEALALAHDLGHAPFGHMGERGLENIMRPFGGFDHNIQTLRVLTQLERRYQHFDGLNLTWNTLEGTLKHNGPLVDNVPAFVRTLDSTLHLELERFSALEAQAAALADDITYNVHDIDDGLRAGLFCLDELAEISEVAAFLETLPPALRCNEPERASHELSRWLITVFIEDTGQHTLATLRENRLETWHDVRAHGQTLVTLPPHLTGLESALRQFLSQKLYHSPAMQPLEASIHQLIAELFACYMNTPQQMPAPWGALPYAGDEAKTARKVCDFIAGMTDRYALARHTALFGDALEKTIDTLTRDGHNNRATNPPPEPS